MVSGSSPGLYSTDLFHVCRDFRLPRVVSINVSGHKYGLTYAGVGWAVWRSPEYLPKDLIFNINYLGSDQVSQRRLDNLLFWSRDANQSIPFLVIGFLHSQLQ